jgi:putative peptidoglycan lipid II flippase
VVPFRDVSTRRKLLAAAGGMTAITSLSRLTGYARDKAVAALLGAGPVADAFYAGLAIPNMFRALLAEGALHAAFIPTLAELERREDEDARLAFVRAMTGALVAALPVLVAAGMLAAPWLVRLFAPGLLLEGGDFDLAVRFTRQMFPYLAFISLAALAQGVLNASGRFYVPAGTPILLNLCAVAGTAAAVLAGGSWWWMSAAVVLGGALQLAVQLPACARVGLPLWPGGNWWRHPEVRRVLALMLPGIPALGVYQLTLLLSYRFASSVGPGAITARFNAIRLSELIYGGVIVQLTTAVLPMLSAERGRDPDEARRTLGFAARLISAVAVPAAVLLAVLATPVCGVLFGGGRYDLAAVRMTAGALAMYACGLPFLGMTKLLASASYAWQDTRSPVWAALGNLAVFFAAGTVLTPPFGVAGIAAAASLGQLANAVVLLWLNGRSGRLPRSAEVVPAMLRHLLAAAAAGVAVWAVAGRCGGLERTSVTGLATVGLLYGGGLLVYLGCTAALRSPEWRELRALLAARRS